MRLPYITEPPTSTSTSTPAPTTTTTFTAPPTLEEVTARIRARRAPRGLQALDLTLLHSPAIADGWNSFLGAVRTRTSLAADVRELAIARVAVVNGAWYEWDHHAPLAIGAGVGEAGMAVARGEGALLLTGSASAGEAVVPPEGLDEKQWVVLCYADEMTRNVEVKEETFERLKALFSEQEVVEITATVACYNCVSRFLVALDVGERNGTGPGPTH